MSEAHPTIEAVLSAHGVAPTVKAELRRGPRAPAAIDAIIEDILLIQPDQDWRTIHTQHFHPAHEASP